MDVLMIARDLARQNGQVMNIDSFLPPKPYAGPSTPPPAPSISSPLPGPPNSVARKRQSSPPLHWKTKRKLAMLAARESVTPMTPDNAPIESEGNTGGVQEVENIQVGETPMSTGKRKEVDRGEIQTGASYWNSLLIRARSERGPQWDYNTQSFLVDRHSTRYYTHGLPVRTSTSVPPSDDSPSSSNPSPLPLLESTPQQTDHMGSMEQYSNGHTSQHDPKSHSPVKSSIPNTDSFTTQNHPSQFDVSSFPSSSSQPGHPSRPSYPPKSASHTQSPYPYQNMQTSDTYPQSYPIQNSSTPQGIQRRTSGQSEMTPSRKDSFTFQQPIQNQQHNQNSLPQLQNQHQQPSSAPSLYAQPNVGGVNPAMLQLQTELARRQSGSNNGQFTNSQNPTAPSGLTMAGIQNMHNIQHVQNSHHVGGGVQGGGNQIMQGMRNGMQSMANGGTIGQSFQNLTPQQALALFPQSNSQAYISSNGSLGPMLGVGAMSTNGGIGSDVGVGMAQAALGGPLLSTTQMVEGEYERVKDSFVVESCPGF
ncbi:hypothetical protein TREMEDRAFT_62521 [Tremella mesenterica DSM 1558]|uniref:uncharacterized protein n=1 Tax=Tremella mesenterica (strain ATCC 24925 / CBS 8224 / DSM 1558 / NBRC 9311 / NRRL Y-6157 / RJB 2259-6 / UBC 559-6) TaxID=578456 RepID=UPI0003F496CE|nr:uncharacterized protein TREMEDRAFT_62521 [Tremella mesenterica DSM 1558]EIW69652.1 hypothetical protein TREMEDRAFT_62521 [Tremella mesenterica DSM 1558]